MVAKIVVLVVLTGICFVFLRLQRLIFIPPSFFKWFLLFVLALFLIIFFFPQTGVF